jgi:hypothetical protein
MFCINISDNHGLELNYLWSIIERIFLRGRFDCDNLKYGIKYRSLIMNEKRRICQQPQKHSMLLTEFLEGDFARNCTDFLRSGETDCRGDFGAPLDMILYQQPLKKKRKMEQENYICDQNKILIL